MGCTSSSTAVQQPPKRPESFSAAKNAPNEAGATTATTAQKKVSQPVINQPGSDAPSNNNNKLAPTAERAAPVVSSASKVEVVTETADITAKRQLNQETTTTSNSKPKEELKPVDQSIAISTINPSQGSNNKVESSVAVKSPYDTDNEDFQEPLATSLDDSSSPTQGIKGNDMVKTKKQLDFEQFLSHRQIEAMVQAKLTTEEKLCDYYLTVDDDCDGYINEEDIDIVIELVKKDNEELEKQKEANRILRKKSLNGNGTPGKKLVPLIPPLSPASPDSVNDGDEEGIAPRFISNMTDVTVDSISYATPHKPELTPVHSNSPNTPSNTDPNHSPRSPSCISISSSTQTYDGEEVHISDYSGK